MFNWIKSKALVIFISIVAMFGIAAGANIALTSTSLASSSETIYACVTSAGLVRYATESTKLPVCKVGEHIVSWSASIYSPPSPTTTSISTSTTTSTTTTTVPITTTTTTVAPATINWDKPFSSTSPWNTPTPSNVTWTNYAPMNTSDWWVNGGWVPYRATATDPLWTFNMPDFVSLSYNKNRPAQSFQMRAPSNIAPSTDSDGQLVVVEPDGSYIEVWRAAVDSTNHIVTSNGPGWATGNVITGLGVGGLVSNGGNNAGTRAANFSISGGRISSNEMNGSTPIDHALVICLPSSMMFNGNQFVSPATAGDSFGTGTIVMGTKFGIPQSSTMPSGLTPLGQKIFSAFQIYGGYVGDFCGGGVPILQSDATNGFWQSDLKTVGSYLRVAS